MMAKQGSHVPKFGNWDDDNIPYTTYFENARRDKTGVRMNPNDPEGNPENGYTPRRPVQPPPANSSISSSSQKHRAEEYPKEKPRQGNILHHQNSKGHKTVISDSKSDKTSFDRSDHISGNRHSKTHRPSSISDGSNRSTSFSVHSRQRNESLQSQETHHRTASIPKFGAWDEGDPNSADGFTLIFNKVKEKKQTAASEFPNAREQPSRYSTNSRVDGARSSSRSKICCCFFLEQVIDSNRFIFWSLASYTIAHDKKKILM